MSGEWADAEFLDAARFGLRPLGQLLRQRHFDCVTFAGIARAHLSRIYLGWRPWLPSRRTASVVARWFGATRRVCSRDWRSDWPFSGAVGNYRTAIPANRTSGAGGGFLTGGTAKAQPACSTGLNAPCGAGCFLTRMRLLDGDRCLKVLMHLLVLGAFCWESALLSTAFGAQS